MYAQLIMFTSNDMILNFRVYRVLAIKNKNGTCTKILSHEYLAVTSLVDPGEIYEEIGVVMYLHNYELTILKKGYHEKWENAYLIV